MTIVIDEIYLIAILCMLICVFFVNTYMLYIYFLKKEKIDEKLVNFYNEMIEDIKKYSFDITNQIKDQIAYKLRLVEELETRQENKLLNLEKNISPLFEELKEKDKLISNLQQNLNEAIKREKEKNGVIERKNTKIDKLRKKLLELENEN